MSERFRFVINRGAIGAILGLGFGVIFSVVWWFLQYLQFSSSASDYGMNFADQRSKAVLFNLFDLMVFTFPITFVFACVGGILGLIFSWFFYLNMNKSSEHDG